jgi:hypothetical protein
MTLKSIDEVVTLLAEAFGQKVTPIRLMAYEAGLSDVPLSALNAAVVRAIRESRFMPTVAELRELCGVVSGRIEAKDRPLLAWEAVRRAISRVGAYDSPNFADPVIHAVLRSMGGWTQVCDWTLDEMPWREKEFKAAYAAMFHVQLPDEMTSRLAGIAEKENGLAIPAQVVAVGCLSVGTSGESARLMEADTKTLTGPAPSAMALAKRLDFDDRNSDLTPATEVRKTREEQIAALAAMQV